MVNKKLTKQIINDKLNKEQQISRQCLQQQHLNNKFIRKKGSSTKFIDNKFYKEKFINNKFSTKRSSATTSFQEVWCNLHGQQFAPVWPTVKVDYSSSILQIDKKIQNDNIINKEEIEKKADDNNEFIMSSSEGGREQRQQGVQDSYRCSTSADAGRQGQVQQPTFGQRTLSGQQEVRLRGTSIEAKYNKPIDRGQVQHAHRALHRKRSSTTCASRPTSEEVKYNKCINKAHRQRSSSSSPLTWLTTTLQAKKKVTTTSTENKEFIDNIGIRKPWSS